MNSDRQVLNSLLLDSRVVPSDERAKRVNLLCVEAFEVGYGELKRKKRVAAVAFVTVFTVPSPTMV